MSRSFLKINNHLVDFCLPFKSSLSVATLAKHIPSSISLISINAVIIIPSSAPYTCFNIYISAEASRAGIMSLHKVVKTCFHWREFMVEEMICLMMISEKDRQHPWSL